MIQGGANAPPPPNETLICMYTHVWQLYVSTRVCATLYVWTSCKYVCVDIVGPQSATEGGRRKGGRREGGEGEGRREVGRKEDHGSYRLSRDCQFYLMPPEALIKHLIITIYGLG